MWKFIKTGSEGNCTLFGENIFDLKWTSTGQKIEVADPNYDDQKHILVIYSVEIGAEKKEFAAGEFSNGVYGFYVRL